MLSEDETMYFQMIQQFQRTLKNLDTILGKAQQHAEARKFDVNNFLTTRLAPDMLTFTRQVQIVSDVAKGTAAALAGKEPPKYADDETSFEQLRERVRKTASYLEGFREGDFGKLTDKTIVKISYPQGKAMYAPEMLLSRAVPNFFFHVGMAYALLRNGGVDIGKNDYLGQLPMLDA
jgi:hypothetical protein